MNRFAHVGRQASGRRLARAVCKRAALIGMCSLAAMTGVSAQDGAISGVMVAMSANQGAALTAPPRAATPMDAAARERVQNRISRAETNFQLGLDQYRAANAGGHADTIPGRDHLRQAKAYFLLAKDDLEHALPAFGDAAESADAERRLDALALLDYNERLLLSVERAGEP